VPDSVTLVKRKVKCFAYIMMILILVRFFRMFLKNRGQAFRRVSGRFRAFFLHLSKSEV
jgi:hypothetical protein